MQNWARNMVTNYKGYQNISIDKSWIRSRNFQFRLVDLEFVLQDALAKYPKLYMNPISFSCSLADVVSGFIDPSAAVLNQILDWNCKGFLILDNKTQVQILGTSPIIQISLPRSIIRSMCGFQEIP